MQALSCEFEVLAMKEGESIDDFFSRTLSIVSRMKAQGEKIDQILIVEKVFRLMTVKFNNNVCSIEKSKDVTTLSIDELQSSLLVCEQCMKSYRGEEQALKVTNTGHCYGQRRSCIV